MKDPVTKARIPLHGEQFTMHAFANFHSDNPPVALTLGEVKDQSVLVRVHSECLTGDVFGSRRCDCGEQLEHALCEIAAAKKGVLIYLRQEGRGIGLVEKLKAYNLQDQGRDTVDANKDLGHHPDSRNYEQAAHILKHLGVKEVQLLTNNPEKVFHLNKLGIQVSRRRPVPVFSNIENKTYLQTKATRMNHFIQLPHHTPHELDS